MTTSQSPSESSPLPKEAFLAAPGRKRSQLRFWLLVIGGMIGALCFGGCLLISWFCEARQTTVAAEVLPMAEEIIHVTVPAGYVGESAEKVRTPLFTVRKAVFRHESGQGVLSLVEMQMIWSLTAKEDEAIQHTLDQLAPDMRQLVVADDAARTISIGGKSAKFHLRSGHDTLSSTKLHEVRGLFRGKTGTAQLWLQAEDSIWDDAAVERMLQSLSDGN